MNLPANTSIGYFIALLVLIVAIFLIVLAMVGVFKDLQTIIILAFFAFLAAARLL